MENLFENDVKFLLYAHHIKTLDIYEEFVKKKNIKYIRMDGSVTLKRR